MPAQTSLTGTRGVKKKPPGGGVLTTAAADIAKSGYCSAGQAQEGKRWVSPPLLSRSLYGRALGLRSSHRVSEERLFARTRLLASCGPVLFFSMRIPGKVREY